MSEFCVVVCDEDGFPHFVSNESSKIEATNLRNLFCEGKVLPATEGKRFRERMERRNETKIQSNN